MTESDVAQVIHFFLNLCELDSSNEKIRVNKTDRDEAADERWPHLRIHPPATGTHYGLRVLGAKHVYGQILERDINHCQDAEDCAKFRLFLAFGQIGTQHHRRDEDQI